MKKLKNNRYEVLALVLILIPLCFWTAQKEGYHMDELLSFELANAEYNPWIVPTQPEGRLAKFMREEIDGENFGESFGNVVRVVQDVLVNRSGSVLANFKADVYAEPVWIDRQQFHDYITVGNQDDFNYLSVYFNVKDDNHPPVHFMLLHTMSSLLQGEIDPWMGCIINIAAVLGCCILLMKMGRQVCGNRWYGIMAALLYGLSAGAVATTLLIRMYGVMTLFCVWVLYLHLQKWEKDNWQKQNKLLILITVLGFLTQYFFLFYMIGLAAVTAVLLLILKKRKELFCYIRSMVIAAVIGIGIYPFAISDVFSSERGVEALGNLAQGLNGYGERLWAFGKILAGRLAGGYIGAVLFLVIVIVAVVRGIYRKKDEQQGNISTVEKVVPWLLTVPLALYFLLASKMSPYLVDRYIMPLFPLTALFVAYMIKRSGIHVRMGIAGVLCLGIFGVATYDGEYLFRGYEEQVQIAEEYRELPCVCVYDGYGYYKNLIEFTEYEKTLLVKAKELETRQSDPVLEDAEQVVVMVKSEIDQNELENLLLEKYGYRVLQELQTDGVHHDSIWLCGR